MKTKICETCKIEKPITDFGIHSRESDGLRRRCKECRKIESKKYREKHKDSIIEYKKKYYQDCKDFLKNYYNEKYQEDEEYRERKRKNSYKYYHSHKEQYKERIKERRANGEFFEIDRNHSHKRRAACKETDITNKFLKELKDATGGFCPICGCEMTEENNQPNQYNLDHIIPISKDGKHMKNNVRFICRNCNATKYNKILPEFKE